MEATIKSKNQNLFSIVKMFFFDIYSYRDYLLQSTLRDFRTKYKRSSLGYLWTILNPLCMMLILSLVFSQVLRVEIKDYPCYLLSGLLPWGYFHSTSMMSLYSVKNNSRLFSQIAVPKYIFVLSLVFSNLVNFVLALMSFFFLVLFFGRAIPLSILAFPLVLLPLFFLLIGVCLVLSALNVFFDDTLHITEVAMQAVYFLLPIIYAPDALPAKLLFFLKLNPLYWQIEFFHQIFYYGELPGMIPFLANLIFSIGVFIFGLVLFKKAENKFLYFI